MNSLQKRGHYPPPMRLVYSSGGIATAKENFFSPPPEQKDEPGRFAEAVEYARNLSAIQREVRSIIEDYASQIAEQFVAPTQTQERSDSVAHKFQELAQHWRAETGHLSSVTKQVMHPSYQRIIGLGPAALPALLQEVRQRSDYWFWALNAITGEDPVQQEDLGNVPKMSEAWLTWGRQRGLI